MSTQEKSSKDIFKMKKAIRLSDPKKGFSLIECVISLSLFLIIILACLEFLGRTRTLFVKLKDKEEAREGVLASLDRIQTDLQQGGSGLIAPAQLGLLEGVSEDDGILIILSREKELSLCSDLVEEQTRILLESTSSLKAGREICIFDSLNGEVKILSSVDAESVVISSPLEHPYLSEKTSIILLRTVSVFLDEKKQVLRRKVNSSPAQPLLEEAGSFSFDLDKAANLVRLRLAHSTNREKCYEIFVFPKNTALASSHQKENEES